MQHISNIESLFFGDSDKTIADKGNFKVQSCSLEPEITVAQLEAKL